MRALAGPALVYADEAAFGLQARVDVALPIARRLHLIAAARGLTIPSLQRASYQLVSLTAGFRVLSR